DGRQVAFERKLGTTRSQIYVARADGSGLTLVTPETVALTAADAGRAWLRYDFSPDGTTLLIATTTKGVPSITLANTDGTGMRELDVGMAATELSFRPPDGREILFSGSGLTRKGLFAVDVATGKVREVRLIGTEFELAARWIAHRLLDVGRLLYGPDGEVPCHRGRRIRRQRASDADRRRVECPR